MRRPIVQIILAAMTAAILPVSSISAASLAEKEQTVYVKADANGQEDNVRVSNWLKNKKHKDELEDYSELSAIENVKGDESYREDSGKLFWKTKGNDIYYQGNSSKELPVSVHITYYLDGREINPEELAGKSGKVKIRVSYENHETKKVKIHGKTETIYTPFMMATGIILPEENFSNVEVDNGKVISDGKNTVVMGLAFPGLKESLHMEDLEKIGDKGKKLDIPESFEITTDAKKFKLAMTATVASSGNLKDLGIENLDDLKKLSKDMNTLGESSQKLVKGARDLQDGIIKYDQASLKLFSGIETLDNGAGSLAEGLATMNGSKGALLEGLDQLADGSSSLKDGSASLANGINTYTDSVSKLAEGLKKTEGGAGQLKKGAAKLSAGMNDKKAGLPALAEGMGQMKSGMATLKSGMDEKLYPGAESLDKGLETYTEGVEKLNRGIQSLSASFLPAMDMLNSSRLQLGQDLQTAGAGIKDLARQAEEAGQAISAINQAVEESNRKIDSANGVMDSLEAAAQETKASLDEEVDTANTEMTAAYDAARAAIDASSMTEEEKASVLEAIGNPPELSHVEMEAYQAEKIEELTPIDGSSAAKAGAAAQAAGEDLQKTKSALEGIGQMAGQADTVAKGIKELSEGSSALAENGKAIKAGSRALKNGLAKSQKGIDQVVAGLTGIDTEKLVLAAESAQELSLGAAKLETATKQLNAGAGQVVAYNDKLKKGAMELAAGSAKLEKGSLALSDGGDELSAGIEKLADGSSKLKDGSTALAAGADQLQVGGEELEKGSGKLTKGMETFDEKGIKKLTKLAEGDLSGFADRFEALVKADEDYRAFDGKGNTNSQVKFIIETAAIE